MSPSTLLLTEAILNRRAYCASAPSKRSRGLMNMIDFHFRKVPVIALTAFLLAGSSIVFAQDSSAPAAAPRPAAAKPKPNWPPEGPTPRTADGKPDLTGNWSPNAIRENVDLAA